MIDKRASRYTMFAILMAITNLGTGVDFSLTGSMVDAIGYRWTFATVAVLNLVVLPLIPPLFRQRGPVTPHGRSAPLDTAAGR